MPIADEIAQRIAVFRAALLQGGVQHALTEHILRHDCGIIGAEMERTLRGAVAEKYHLEVAEVYLVGSAKLGFSPKPGQYFKPFSDASDLDLAIVSSDLYVKIWHEVNDMERAGEYFNSGKFRHYHSMGWIRPDALPASTEYETCSDWWEYFRELSAREDFQRQKVSAGLYYDEAFLRRYQSGGLTVLRDHLAGAGQ